MQKRHNENLENLTLSYHERLQKIEKIGVASSSILLSFDENSNIYQYAVNCYS